MKHLLALLPALAVSFACSSSGQMLPDWAIGPFVRPDSNSPVISPDTSAVFYCPMRRDSVAWMESDTFNPAAAVKDGRIFVLFRSEDNSAVGIGTRTSRIGLAESEDGLNMSVRPEPVLFPGGDDMEVYDCPGGCEDPRVAVTEDGTYVMMYTSWNRKVPRLCVATSEDLVHWTKHGPVFAEACGGRFRDMACKSGSLVTRLDRSGKQVIARVKGKYLMYWGESMINLAISDDLIHWTPSLSEDGSLKGIVFPRDGHFDSALTECGPPAVLTRKGIVLMYNGKNRYDERRDPQYASGTYSAGQILFSRRHPEMVKSRLDEPFFVPSAPFEKTGQYPSGTVFVEGLVRFCDHWFLYYGCADSRVGVAVN